MQNAQPDCKSHEGEAAGKCVHHFSRRVAEQIGPGKFRSGKVELGTTSAYRRAKHAFKILIERIDMLNWTVTFLIVALIAAALGFGGIAGTAAGIAKVLFVVFLIFFLISLITGRRRV